MKIMLCPHGHLSRLSGQQLSILSLRLIAPNLSILLGIMPPTALPSRFQNQGARFRSLSNLHSSPKRARLRSSSRHDSSNNNPGHMRLFSRRHRTSCLTGRTPSAGPCRRQFIMDSQTNTNTLPLRPFTDSKSHSMEG